jgi:hypothetical protein
MIVATTTMQVRVLRPGAESTHFFYFENVSAERAVELARMHCAARCISVAYFEVRDDAYPSLNEPPLLTAPGSER